MPECSKADFPNSDNTVHLEGKLVTFRLLLLLIEKRTISPIAWSGMQEVLDLAARYQFFLVPTLIAQFIQQNKEAAPDPWKLFLFASKYDFLFLAKIALSQFDISVLVGSRHAWQIDSATLRLLPFSYATALLRAMARYPGTHNEYGVLSHDWKLISNAFDPNF
jgi:uncharacterized protein YbgA (DUF1722 family)